MGMVRNKTESALCQSYKKLSLQIVQNGSVTDVSELAHKWTNGFSRIPVLVYVNTIPQMTKWSENFHEKSKEPKLL